MAKPVSIEVWNPNGKYRVVSTKPMPGTRWINLLTQQDCRVEVIIIILILLFFYIILLCFLVFLIFFYYCFFCCHFIMIRYAHSRKLYCLLKILLLSLEISVMVLLDRFFFNIHIYLLFLKLYYVFFSV